MNIKAMFDPNEKPLDRLVEDGGFCSIFRTIGCIGDSLSSGEFEGYEPDGTRVCIDMFDYSWGQFMARTLGSKVYNFSIGGLSARGFCEDFAKNNNLWNPAKKCQAYIIAFGVNDVSGFGKDLGDVSDIDTDNWKNNKKTFAGYYAQIIQRMKEIQPEAKFFLVTVPRDNADKERSEAYDIHQTLIHQIAGLFSNTYVLDFRQYAPDYDEDFRKNFYMTNHLNPMGYVLTAKMMMSYIDYIIRHNMDDFKRVGFIGTEFENLSETKNGESNKLIHVGYHI